MYPFLRYLLSIVQIIQQRWVLGEFLVRVTIIWGNIMWITRKLWNSVTTGQNSSKSVKIRSLLDWKVVRIQTDLIYVYKHGIGLYMRVSTRRETHGYECRRRRKTETTCIFVRIQTLNTQIYTYTSMYFTYTHVQMTHLRSFDHTYKPQYRTSTCIFTRLQTFLQNVYTHFCTYTNFRTHDYVYFVTSTNFLNHVYTLRVFTSTNNMFHVYVFLCMSTCFFERLRTQYFKYTWLIVRIQTLYFTYIRAFYHVYKLHILHIIHVI